MDYKNLYEAELRRIERCRFQFESLVRIIREIRESIDTEEIGIELGSPSRFASSDDRPGRTEEIHSLELSDALEKKIRDASPTFAGDVGEEDPQSSQTSLNSPFFPDDDCPF